MSKVYQVLNNFAKYNMNGEGGEEYIYNQSIFTKLKMFVTLNAW